MGKQKIFLVALCIVFLSLITIGLYFFLHHSASEKTIRQQGGNGLSAPGNGNGNGNGNASGSATMTISGIVFVDTNMNASQSAGENGFQGATVNLSGDSSATTATDASGNYSFPT